MKNQLFSSILGFNQHWDYKHYNEHISQKIKNLITKDKIHLKCDVIDGSVVNGIQDSVLFNFILDKPPGFGSFC